MSAELIANSLLVAFVATAIALGVGCFVALAGVAASAAVCRSLQMVALVGIATPPFMTVNAWLDVFGRGGTVPDALPWDLYSPLGTGVVVGLMFWPIAFFLVLGAVQRMDANVLECDPMLRGRMLIRFLIWPRVRASIGTAGAVIFAMSLNQFTIPAILQVKVVAAEIWIGLATNLDYSRAVLLSVPLVLAPIATLLFLRTRSIEWPVWRGERRRPLATSLGLPLRLSSVGCTLLAVLVFPGLPLAQLIFTEATWSELPSAASAGAEALGNSALTAAAAAAVATVLALATWRFGGFSAMWIVFLFPGATFSLLAGQAMNLPGLYALGGSIAGLVIALSVRFFALSWHVARHAAERGDPSVVDAARLDGASRWQVFRFALWPQVRGPVLGVACLVYVFALWEVDTILMIVPPGGETVAVRVFNLLHYGHNSQVDALCLALLMLAAVPLLAGFVWRIAAPRGRGRLVLAAICLGLTGCEPREFETVHRIESRFFDRVEVIGKQGVGPGEFNKPRSIALDEEDNLYVVDMTGRVQKLDADGNYILSWQMPETDLGRPKGMTRDRDGNIVVLEPHYSRVNHFNTEGELVHQWGEKGVEAGELHLPRAVVQLSTGEWVAAEFSRIDRLQRFSADGSVAEQVVGGPGPGEGEFNRPEGLDVDGEDRVYVADSCNHRVQVFDRDGVFLRSYGAPGSGVGEMSYPYDVRIDGEGFQFVCEFGNSRVQIFDPNDRPVETLGGSGSAPGKFFNPWSLAFDSRGNLYVADSKNHRVQKFVRKDAE
jgi:ABC-type Fe3+ transport system permease subunit/sugar lactone lactonase YvrE